MFAKRLLVETLDAAGAAAPCPLHWIDNFAMRNFTNDAIFDDTLPVADGVLEVGYRVPIEALEHAMEDWFRRKGYLKGEHRLKITPESAAASAGGSG